jgi:hypothetical protein
MILLLSGKSGAFLRISLPAIKSKPIILTVQPTLCAHVSGQCCRGAPVPHTSTAATTTAPSTFTVVFRVNGSEGSPCDPEVGRRPFHFLRAQYSLYSNADLMLCRIRLTWGQM